MCEALCQVLSIQYLSQSLQLFKLNVYYVHDTVEETEASLS